MALVQRLVDWTTSIFAPLGSTGLFILAFIESSFFPIPPDLLLITLTLNNPALWLWYALVCTIGSVLGGLFGYLIGYWGEMKILSRFVKQEKIDKVHGYFHKYDAWAIFIAHLLQFLIKFSLLLQEFFMLKSNVLQLLL